MKITPEMIRPELRLMGGDGILLKGFRYAINVGRRVNAGVYPAPDVCFRRRRVGDFATQKQQTVEEFY